MNRSNEHVVEVALAGRYAISPQTLGSVKDVPGVTDIRQF